MITSLRRSLAERTPELWRAPVSVTIAERPWLFIIASFAVVVCMLPFVASRSPGYALIIFVWCGILWALAGSREIVGGDRTATRWVLLFQRPGRAAAHYARAGVLSLAITLCLVLLAGAVFAVSAAFTGVNPRLPAGAISAGLAWALVVLCVSCGISALVRQNNIELTLLLIFVSFMQTVVVHAIGLPPTVSTVLEFLLFPVNALNRVWTGFAAGGSAIDTPHLIHLVLYPLAWLAIGFYRINALERSDLADVTGR